MPSSNGEPKSGRHGRRRKPSQAKPEQPDQNLAHHYEELAAAHAALQRENRDLAARVETEAKAREQVQVLLFQQQKLEALGQLTGGVAHDFNNLLTVVLSGLHMLRRADTQQRRQQLIDRIEQAAGRGSELTRRLLAFGRRETTQPQAVDLAVRLNESATLLSHALRGDLRIEVRTEPDVWPVTVDLGGLELALLNLAINARDAMLHGGTITITAKNVTLETRTARKFGLRPGEYVALSMTDSGTGMRRAVREHAFEPFFTTKDARSGTGLGLSQVHGFTVQAGGTAYIQSEWGEGSTITMLLPRGTEAPLAQAEPLAAAEKGLGRAGGRRPHILVVEDDDEVAALVLDLLDQFRCTATRVSSVDAALGALSNARRIDLVLADILLSGGATGVDLAHEVERRRSDLPVILTSGRDLASIPALSEIRWPLLRKPFEPEFLRAAIEQALAARRAPDKPGPQVAAAC